MNALELRGLTKHYKDFTLGPLDLTLPGGTICGLIGENETNEIINDDSTYPFISYLSDLLAKSKPSDDVVKKLHDCIDKVAVALGQDSTDVFRALLAKLIEQPGENQTFDRLLEMAEKFAAKYD